MRIDFAVNKHLERYKGDGTYSDGDLFQWDYYNELRDPADAAGRGAYPA